MIETNTQLIELVKNEIKESGIKKIALAEKLGISRQALNNLLKKQSFSLDDANKILSILNKKAIAEIKKVSEMQ